MAQKKPQIALSKQYLLRSEGGTNHFRIYNLACLLHIGLDWILQASKCTNYALESQVVHPLNLAWLENKLMEHKLHSLALLEER